MVVGNKMHKAFPLPVMEFPLAEEVPTASEESSHCQKKRDATAEKIALLLESSSNCSASNGTGKKKGRTVTLTADDMQKRKNVVKARTTLLLSLPDEHQLRIRKYKTAQELWAVILKTFGGNEATKKTKKNLLKQQYGNFKAEGSKTLEQMFNRLQKKSEPNSQNMAFISSAKHSSGNEEVNTASVSTASTNVSIASANIGIDEDDMKEMDIKWNMALLSMRADRFWKKTGKKIKSTSDDAQNRNPSVTKTKASPSTISPKRFIKFVKANDSPTKSKTDKVETAKKPPVKYAEQYRKPTKKPNLKSHQLGTSRSQNNTHKSFTPRPAVYKPYRPPMRPIRSNMNVARPNRTSFNKPAHSYTKRPFQRTSAVRSQYKAPWGPIVKRHFPSVNRKFSNVSRNVSNGNRKFLTANRKFPTGSTKFSTADLGKKEKAVKASAWLFWKPSQNLSNKGPNINSVSVMFKKYTYIDTQGRLKDFKLLDDANVLLRTPRQHNMYSIDLNNIVSHKDLTCLVAKAAADEGTKAAYGTE
nr:ribonuclease H-like domain-containing protein [Tanacetum cinerariifolium]